MNSTEAFPMEITVTAHNEDELRRLTQAVAALAQPTAEPLAPVAQAAEVLFDNRLGWSDGRNPYAPRELWADLGAALYGEADERVKELRAAAPALLPAPADDAISRAVQALDARASFERHFPAAYQFRADHRQGELDYAEPYEGRWEGWLAALGATCPASPDKDGIKANIRACVISLGAAVRHEDAQAKSTDRSPASPEEPK